MLGQNHLQILDVERKTGAKFTIVQFDGGSAATTALMGGHVDTYIGCIGDFGGALKSGQVRLLGVMERQEHPLAPGVPTLESQGIKVYTNSSRGFALPSGAPREISVFLRAALKKVMAEEDHRKRAAEAGLGLRYMDAPEYTAYWDEYEALVRDLLDLAKKGS